MPKTNTNTLNRRKGILNVHDCNKVYTLRALVLAQLAEQWIVAP